MPYAPPAWRRVLVEIDDKESAVAPEIPIAMMMMHPLIPMQKKFVMKLTTTAMMKSMKVQKLAPGTLMGMETDMV